MALELYFVAFQRESSALLSRVSSVRNFLIHGCLIVLISFDNCWLILFRRFLSFGFLDWCNFLLRLHFSAIRFLICRPLGYKNSVRTSQETNYFSATEPSLSILCKVWCFHGGDYEECPLGHKNPVLTSQETYYFSATESSRLKLCKIWGFHGDYEECRLLGCYTLWLL
jgi:hypothetical protein